MAHLCVTAQRLKNTGVGGLLRLRIKGPITSSSGPNLKSFKDYLTQKYSLEKT